MFKSSHFVLVKYSDPFFRQFDLAIKLRRKELKKQGKVDTEVSEVTEGDLIEVFGITKDHMTKAGEILSKNENTENLGNSSE